MFIVIIIIKKILLLLLLLLLRCFQHTTNEWTLVARLKYHLQFGEMQESHTELRRMEEIVPYYSPIAVNVIEYRVCKVDSMSAPSMSFGSKPSRKSWYHDVHENMNNVCENIPSTFSTTRVVEPDTNCPYLVEVSAFN